MGEDDDRGLLWRLPVMKMQDLGKLGPGFGIGAGCGVGFGFGLFGGNYLSGLSKASIHSCCDFSWIYNRILFLGDII